MIEIPYKEDFLLEIQNNNYSPETVYNYKRDLSVFEGFLNLNGIDFALIDKRVITHYKGFLREESYILKLIESGWDIPHANLNNELDKDSTLQTQRPSRTPSENMAILADSNSTLSPRSINRMVSAIRSYLKSMIDFDLKPVPIAPDAIKLIKTERKETQVAELPELISLIEYPTLNEKDPFVAARNRAILELLFSTGMRISELCRLNREQINEEGKIYVMGKGKKQRFVYLTDRAIGHLNDYLKLRKDRYPALFVPTRGGRSGHKAVRLSANYLQEKIALYRRSLGIVVPTSAHSLRHGFATYLAEEGANPAAIQILLGHESLHTTNRYVHASDKYAQETHRKFHPLYEKEK